MKTDKREERERKRERERERKREKCICQSFDAIHPLMEHSHTPVFLCVCVETHNDTRTNVHTVTHVDIHVQ